MKFHIESSEVFAPDGLPAEEALARTTCMTISAHQDDIEIMASAMVVDCFQRTDKWFAGVVVTNGAGSPRDDVYKEYSDADMIVVRRKEQKKAAYVGEYSAQVLLDYPSGPIKDKNDKRAVEDLVALLKVARPEIVITHNLADKHDTHIGVTVKVIEAIRSLPQELRPKKLYGGEVWRDLDWMSDSDKVVLDCSTHENLQAALLGVFDSQIAGGKRYDLSSMGRRKAHATYHASHGVDATHGLNFAMDMTPLITDPSKSIAGFAKEHIDRFAKEIADRLAKLA
jgi:LmbE family N-acetylglucosaminyl deacetylase